MAKSIYYVPLNVQTLSWAWRKLATDNFGTVLTKNLRNPRDYAPLIVSTLLFQKFCYDRNYAWIKMICLEQLKLVYI